MFKAADRSKDIELTETQRSVLYRRLIETAGLKCCWSERAAADSDLKDSSLQRLIWSSWCEVWTAALGVTRRGERPQSRGRNEPGCTWLHTVCFHPCTPPLWVYGLCSCFMSTGRFQISSIFQHHVTSLSICLTALLLGGYPESQWLSMKWKHSEASVFTASAFRFLWSLHQPVKCGWRSSPCGAAVRPGCPASAARCWPACWWGRRRWPGTGWCSSSSPPALAVCLQTAGTEETDSGHLRNNKHNITESRNKTW